MTSEEKIRMAELVLNSDTKTMLSPKLNEQIERFDKSVSNVKDTFGEINNALDKANMIIDYASIIWNCTLDTVKAVKELDLVMKQIDVSLEKYLIDADVNLEKFRINAKMVDKQLDRISDKIDTVLDKAMSIDSKTCSDVEIELRSKLITQVRDWSDHISSLLMKLMSI